MLHSSWYSSGSSSLTGHSRIRYHRSHTLDTTAIWSCHWSETRNLQRVFCGIQLSSQTERARISQCWIAFIRTNDYWAKELDQQQNICSLVIWIGNFKAAKASSLKKAKVFLNCGRISLCALSVWYITLIWTGRRMEKLNGRAQWRASNGEMREMCQKFNVEIETLSSENAENAGLRVEAAVVSGELVTRLLHIKRVSCVRTLTSVCCLHFYRKELISPLTTCPIRISMSY